MNTKSHILIILFLAINPMFVISRAEGSAAIELTPTETHHIAKLNSNQPYVAGFHVNTEDLCTYHTVNATAVTVSFPSVETSFFPEGSWIGGGMFVQAQDHVFINVDYGFYTMLVMDASANLFIDLGLHQTREGTAPLQAPTEDTVYAYTWRISGLNSATPITLLAQWDENGFVHYSISVFGSSFTLTSINVSALPNCENIIRKFYTGNVIVYPFPFSRYVNYFQFGVVSSETIANNHWTVDLKDPKMLGQTGWVFVDKAWSIQGDIAYIDMDWRWGGAPYHGVDVQYESLYEIIFHYNGRTLAQGKVLWDYATSKPKDATTAQSTYSDQTLGMRLICYFTAETIVLVWIVLLQIRLKKVSQAKFDTA